ncbi:MAG: FAD-dependent oxidoreductase, partial [Acidimicrobiales bacterium]
FHLYFLGSSEGLVFDVPDAPFPEALWSPLSRYLTDRGVDIRTGTTVAALERDSIGLTVHTGHRSARRFDAVVLACDPGALRRLVSASGGLGTAEWRADVAALRVAPPFLVRRLWLDRPVASSRPAFLGTGSFSPLDNISVLDRYETEARRWTGRTGGSVVELHAYAAATDDRDGLSRQLEKRLHEIYPETADATVIGDLTLWRQDCPLFAVGGFARRPQVSTPDDDVVLAGDGIRVDLPVALMERAATTGWLAANRLLARWGIAGHPLRSVPNRGRLAVLRGLAKRAAR